MARSASKKTTGETVTKVPQPHGGALNAGGTPGNKGGGRPPNVFKDFLARLRADPKFHEELEKAATDRESKGFNAALKLVSDYDDEKPAEKRQIVGPVEVRVKIVREGRRVTAS